MKQAFGFTLVELLVVIAVIGVLMGIAVVSLNPAGLHNRAQDSRRLADLATIQSAMELYFADHNGYPADLLDPDLPTLPEDPDGGSYDYCVDSTDFMEYQICAGTETTPRPNDCQDPGTLGCTEICCLTNPF